MTKRIIEYLLMLTLLAVVIFIGRNRLAVYYYNQGYDYYSRNQFIQAVDSFARSLKLKPEAAITHFSLASAYQAMGKDEEALKEFRRTLELKEDDIDAYQAISRIYCSRQQYDAALQLLEEAENKLPANAEIRKLSQETSFAYLADCLDKSTELFLAGQKQEAYRLLEKGLKLNPNFAFGQYTLAYYYFLDHLDQEAERVLNNLKKIDAQFWPAYKLLGDIYFNQGRYQDAISQYKIAINLNSNDRSLRNDLGLALMQVESYKEALDQLREAVRLDPDNLDTRYSLASVLRDKGMPNEAILEYQKIVSIRPDYPNVHNDLADIYYNQQKKEEALEEYRKEIRYSQERLTLNPQDAVTLNDLAYALNGIGEYDKAKENINQALSLRPNYRQAYLTLAKIQEGQGNLKAAQETLNKAKELSSQAEFIERDISRIKKEAGAMPDVIYLKNGRKIQGRIKEEDSQKVVIEMRLGDALGNLTFYRGAVERIARNSTLEK